MIDRNELWRELERSLTSLVQSMSTSVDKKTLWLLKDYIDNREYGLALESLYDAIVDLRTELSPHQKQEIERLAGLMQISLPSRN